MASGEKFVSDTRYIKRWVTELTGCSPHEIHALHEKSTRRPNGYPPPIVDHAVATHRAE